MSARWEPKDFLSAVTGKQQTDYQTRDTINGTCESMERVHDRSGCTISIFAVKTRFVGATPTLLLSESNEAAAP
jgi:hypothetical protein